jgi:hypothetical protein
MFKLQLSVVIEGARFARAFDYKENKPREARTLNDN